MPASEQHVQQRAAVYVHIPFCRARCAYCDFNTTTGLDGLIPSYLGALEREIELAVAQRGRLAVPTLYFGGGTPSLMPLAGLARLLECLRRTFFLAPDAEITLEANPGTVTLAYLRGLRALGVNRLSLGVQSACRAELARLGRIHTWAQTVEAVAWAREVGFANLSLDLIYGLPRQSLRRWRETLEAALGLAPEHLSLYALTVEEGTPLAQRIAAGELPMPDEDRAAAMYETAETYLAQAGFWHYEISNWARRGIDQDQMPNEQITNGLGVGWWRDGWQGTSEEVSRFVCRHNLVYWRNEAWLGLGAGAHSWLGGARWANLAWPPDYVAALQRGVLPVAEREEIGTRLELGETMMLGLRLAEGVSGAHFRDRFGQGLADVFGPQLAELAGLGLLEWYGQAARLTARGRLLGNQVFSRFL